MDFLIMLYSIGIVICLGILAWFKTKSGKRWLSGGH